MLRIAFHFKAGDARQNITFASLLFPIAINVDRAHDAGPATFPFSLMLALRSASILMIRPLIINVLIGWLFVSLCISTMMIPAIQMSGNVSPLEKWVYYSSLVIAGIVIYGLWYLKKWSICLYVAHVVVVNVMSLMRGEAIFPGIVIQGIAIGILLFAFKFFYPPRAENNQPIYKEPS